MRRPRRPWAIAGAVGAVVVVVLLVWFWPFSRPTAPAAPPPFDVEDATGDLGPVFHPGIVLGAASNASTTLLGGIGVYVRSPEFSLPVLASFANGSFAHDTRDATVTNLTDEVANDFYEGGVYGIGWNGSAWLVAGQASWGGGNFGALVRLDGSRAINLTAELDGDFVGGGIFAMGWNGTAWLLGGNSSQGPVLVSFAGGKTTDLSSHLVTYDRLGWIQLLAWNGTAWLVGGEGVLGTWTGARYSNLWPSSPYGGEGVYSAGWNGTAWLLGGGAGRVEFLRGGTLSPGPTLPSDFDQSVLLIDPIGEGWLVGGKGTSPGGGIAPELAWYAGGSSAVRDLSGLLPSSFSGGEIQGGGPSPVLGPTSIVLVGEGGYQRTTGYGLGAMALLSWNA